MSGARFVKDQRMATVLCVFAAGADVLGNCLRVFDVPYVPIRLGIHLAAVAALSYCVLLVLARHRASRRATALILTAIVMVLVMSVFEISAIRKAAAQATGLSPPNFERVVQTSLIHVAVALLILSLVSALIAASRRTTEARIRERRQRRAEAALRESEERYRALFEQAADSVLLIDAETGGIVAFNDRAHENLGYTRDEFQSLGISDFEAVESPQEIARHKQQILAEGSAFFKTKHRRRDGTIRNVLASCRTLSLGGKTYVQSIWRDITEQARAEEELRQSKEQLQAIYDGTADGVLIADTQNRRFLRANTGICRMLGYSEGELIGMSVEDIHPADRLATVLGSFQAMAEDRTHHGEDIPCLRKDGTVFFAAITSRVITFQGRRCAAGVFRDVTERKRKEEEARLHQAELAHVSRLSTVGRMASELAHELNQPLAAIVNYTNGCLRRLRSGQGEPEQILSAMESVSAQAERAGKIMNRLRDFVRRREPQYKDVDINALVREAACLAEPDAKRNDVAVRFCLSDAMPPVQADPIQIEQVILNLLRNGFDAMKETSDDRREILIGTRMTGEDTVEVSIHDCGGGFSGEVEDRLFEPFFTTKPDGLGMGLSISRSIIEAHGGRLWGLSKCGEGSTFRFTVPISHQPEQG